MCKPTIGCRSLLFINLPETDSVFELLEKIRIQRCQGETKLIVTDNTYDDIQSVHPPLIKAIARAHAWNQMLMKNEVSSIKELACQEGISVRYICRLLPLAKLTPDIVETILDGHPHPSLTVTALCDLARVSILLRHRRKPQTAHVVSSHYPMPLAAPTGKAPRLIQRQGFSMCPLERNWG